MALSRSAYVSRLRRAFLLRVHPDRFRNHSEQTRSEQAALVKALANRMHERDFLEWQQYRQKACTVPVESGDYSYLLEGRNGSFLRKRIPLSGTVEVILKSMANALEESGAAASLPSPPLEEQRAAENSSREFGRKLASQAAVDELFNVHSQKGRDLYAFLSNLDRSCIKERKSSRTDAHAAAMEVRRVFQFQAVDATSLGWSSASVVILLKRLLALHEDHGTKFKVDSFYPIRLMFTSDDFHDVLDLYGGVLRLSPSATSLQWLETLRLVTDEKIQLIRQHAAEMIAGSKKVQGALGVKLRKGFSCSSHEYYEFLQRLAPKAELPSESHDHSIMLEPALATVESSQACRRLSVTKEGIIRISAAMDEIMLRDGIAKHEGLARERAATERCNVELRRKASLQVQWKYGVEKVYRSGNLSHDDFMDSIMRILQADESDHRQQLKLALAGNSLGIAGNSHFCHLADDGSLVIPYNWR